MNSKRRPPPSAPPRRASFAARLTASLLSVSLLSVAPPALAQVLPPVSKAPNLPNLGDTERQELSPIMERKLGEEIMYDIRSNKDYLDDPPITEYLNNLGDVLVRAHPGARGEANFNYYFFAVRDGQLNAFALPGGFIAVHSALLLAAQAESELASVLSHEIGHVAQRHIARQLGQQRQDALIPLAAMILAALAARAGGDVAMGVFAAGQGLAIQRQLNFGRDAEREADRVGFQIMGEAGFDTTGMVAFFQRMQSAGRNYSDNVPAYLLTHPLTSDRIADIQARVREQPYRQRLDSLEFYLARSRARVLQDMSTQGLAEAMQFFQGQMMQQSRQQLAAGQYGMSYALLKKGDTAGAQTWIEKARATLNKGPAPGTFSVGNAPTAPTMMLYLDLEIKLAQEDKPDVIAAAVRQAEDGYRQYPASRGIVYQYGEALIAAGRLEDAARFLRDQVQLYREEPELHDILAKAYAKQGKLALQHMALAESYVLQGGTMAALDQLALARKSPDATFYDQAQIDARERDLKARRKEAMGDKYKEGS